MKTTNTIKKLAFVVSLMFAALFQTHAQVSLTATAGTTGPTAYTTVNAALAAITAGTHQGAIIITISANTTEPAYSAANQLLASGVGTAIYQSVKIVPVGNVTVSSSTLTGGRGLLEFIGADSITIDGDDPLTAGTRNLTFQLNTGTTTYTSALRFSSASSTGNGCRDVTVKNCIIIGSRNSATANNIGFGITSNGVSNAALSSVTTGAADNDNMRIENNEFRRCHYGFHSYGIAAYVSDSLVVRNNKFGSGTSAQNIGLWGIYTGYTATYVNSGSAVIEGNEIQVGDYGTGGYSVNIAAINLVAGNAGATIRNNYIHDVNQPSTGGYGAYGIFISNGTFNDSMSVYNNIIRDIKMYPYQTSSPNNWMAMGVYINNVVVGLKFNHNTIVMNQQLNPNPIYSSYCVAIASSMAFKEFNNNILVNNHSSAEGIAVYANSTANFSGSSMDRNNYYVAPGSRLGYYSGNQTTLAAWKTATSKDSNSFNVIPPFVSATDLRLQPAAKTALESGGAPTSVMVDIDGDVRPGPAGSTQGGGTAPDIGADEADMKLDIYGIDSTGVDQITGLVSAGNTNKQVVRIRTYVSGSTGLPLSLSSMVLNTAGSTSALDIAAANVYYTGSNATFSTATQFGTTVASPSGSFTVTGTQSLPVGINYFWVAYDVSPTAVTANVLDVRLDSIQVLGNYYLPSNGSPAGNLQIMPPMTYISSTVTQNATSKIEQGSSNNQIVGVQIVTSPTGAPISLTNFDVPTIGTTALTDILRLKIWSTGNSNVFATTNQFGTTVDTPAATQSISGNMSLTNGVNYFWITYDIPATATLANVVDAAVTSVTVGGIAQVPTVTTPAGSREIRMPYCPSSPGNTGDEEIFNVTFGTLNNSSTCTTLAPGPGSVLELYSNYTTSVPAPNVLKGTSVPFSLTKGTCGGFYGEVVAVYIDFNQNGVLTDAGENVLMTPNATGFLGQIISANITIPCNASLGETRMRVVYEEGFTGPACGGYSWGETEDYTINILDNPAVLNHTTAQQQTGTVAPGTTDRQILRIPVRINGCGVSTATELRFTNTSTTAADITSAKLYRTAGSIFNTTTLVATIASPVGQFSFLVTDTLINNDTTNYWLAYDVSASATLSNTADARFDSLFVLGNWNTPTVSNPTGGVVINAPMTYVSSTATQTLTSKVETGSIHNRIVGLQVVTSAIGSPINVTNIDVATTGTTSLTDITNLKVWYTGNSSTFDTTFQFGATVATPIATHSIAGMQPLTNGTNYFWVTYNIPTAAVLANVVDGEVTSVTVGASAQIPTVTAPTGNREIRAPYCPSSPGNTGDEEIFNVTFGTLNNSSTCTTLAPGPGSVVELYANYTTSVPAPNVLRGTSVPFSMTKGTCGGFYGEIIGVYIDYNQNGLFTDPGETAFLSTVATGTMNQIISSNIVIPCNASLGATRMRVVYEEGTTAPVCGGYSWGETEDYMVNILDNPAAFSYTTAQQQTGNVAPGASDRPVLRVPLRINGCGFNTANDLRFTNTSTSAGDITAAKLYRTTGNTFNTTKLVASVPSPVGQFSFLVTDTLVNNDTTNYWLAYDISASATVSNVADARFDSVFVMGNWQVPAVSNPAGSVLIASPMTYVSSTVTQNIVTKVEQGSSNNQIVGVQVVTSAIGSAINVTNIDVAATGTTNLTDITNLKVWYTGSSNSFATTTQFGTTIATPAATQSIAGSQPLVNGTNYFWVTYDISVAAVLTNAIDAEVTSVTVGGTAQVPTVTAPVGNRQIRAAYCVPTHAGGNFVTNVQFGTMNNTPGAPPTSWYRLFPQTAATTTSLTRGLSTNLTITYDNASIGSIWIDFNDDGVLAASEWTQLGTASAAGTYAIAVPCSAVLGEVRMRIRSRAQGSPNGAGDACTGFGSGECQDYTITITDNPLVFNYTTAEQQTAIVAPGTTDVKILRVPVRANGCGVATVTDMRFTNTSPTASDITAAKLYRTTGSTFNTTTLLGTIVSPTGQFSFLVTDTLVNNDTTNYWLAYDISASAVFTHTADARFDSLFSLTAWQIPAVSNPAGNVLIDVSMTYVSSTVTQNITSKVEQGSVNNQIVGLQVVTSVSGSPINVTAMDVATTGTTALGNITNLKVWYTGTSNTFATTTQFGTTVAAPAATQTVTGAMPVSNGTNYFWITYDIPATATLATVVDAAVTSVTIGGTPQAPTVTAPAGNREIRIPYCNTALHTNACTSDDYIQNVSTTGGSTNISNLLSGCNGMLDNYINYPNQVVTIPQGGSFTINYQAFAAFAQGFKIFIDFNGDGDFFGAGEEVAAAPAATTMNSSVITVPLNALLGVTRLRVRCAYNAIPVDACSLENWGETEDYSINITPAPAPTTYVWNQTAPAAFATAANWTPARSARNLNDRLVFNGGGAVTVNTVTADAVASITVDNATIVTMAAATPVIVNAKDSLKLTSGRIITGNNINLTLGSSATSTGVLTGTGTVQGLFTRWINVTAATYAFPMISGTNSRAATVAFTTAPTSGGTLTVSFMTGTPGTTGLPVTDGALSLDKVASEGVWSLMAGNALTGGTYTITANAQNIAGVSNLPGIALVSRTTNTAPWTAPGIRVTTTGTVSAMVMSRTGLTVFGELGIASDASNVLPVKLISFTATAKTKDVMLNWATATETNNQGFEVEKSIDGRSFSKTGAFVKGAGNSKTMNNYALVDVDAFTKAKVLYYRLKQVDFDGAYTYSPIVKVSAAAMGLNALSVFPNPYNTAYEVSFNALTEGVVAIEMTDLQGRVITSQSSTTAVGENTISMDNVSTVQAGIYFVRVTKDGESTVIKLVKN
ncbi:MAG: BNR-repeat neuraminidase N-terminal domain-containing protein [Bacteroidota bacterium]